MLIALRERTEAGLNRAKPGDEICLHCSAACTLRCPHGAHLTAIPRRSQQHGARGGPDQRRCCGFRRCCGRSCARRTSTADCWSNGSASACTTGLLLSATAVSLTVPCLCVLCVLLDRNFARLASSGSTSGLRRQAGMRGVRQTARGLQGEAVQERHRPHLSIVLQSAASARAERACSCLLYSCTSLAQATR